MATNSWLRSTGPVTSMRRSGSSTDACRVRRFWEGELDEHGFLVHRPGGPEHGRWVFDYDATAEDDDESGYRFGAHAFQPGEYVRSEEGEMHTFQAAIVEPIS